MRARTGDAQLAIQKSTTLHNYYSHQATDVKALAVRRTVQYCSGLIIQCTSETVYVGEDSGALSDVTKGRGTAYGYDVSLSGPVRPRFRAMLILDRQHSYRERYPLGFILWPECYTVCAESRGFLDSTPGLSLQ